MLFYFFRYKVCTPEKNETSNSTDAQYASSEGLLWRTDRSLSVEKYLVYTKKLLLFLVPKRQARPTRSRIVDRDVKVFAVF